MELTDTEKKIIEAYRNGGIIDIWHHNIETYEKAAKLMSPWKVHEIEELDEETIALRYSENTLNVRAFLKH